jgi:HD-GYP domain-containing protein (c-di-GMP phosphodiesterase class II)
MPKYVPVPLERVQLGKPLPVDIWSPDGLLLLRRQQILSTEAHRETLAEREACMTEADAHAWQRALERQMRRFYNERVDISLLAQMPLPSEIAEDDFLPGHEVSGGWMDVQDVLRGLLYQGTSAIDPLPRLDALEDRALSLQQSDPDEGLFTLFQALPDLSLGYCATHALLSGLVCTLTADKLGLPSGARATLMRAALVMNIGMARLQDNLARQKTAPSSDQRQDIDNHAALGVAILKCLNVQNPTLLDIVQWHHTPDLYRGEGTALVLVNLMNLADALIAKMAPRQVRHAMLPLAATKMLVMQSSPDTAKLRQAMAAALGFYPPGSYVHLANGETAVVISRGMRANSPHVASIISARGMPLNTYNYRDTCAYGLTVTAPVAAHTVHVKVNPDKVMRLRQLHGV